MTVPSMPASPHGPLHAIPFSPSVYVTVDVATSCVALMQLCGVKKLPTPVDALTDAAGSEKSSHANVNDAVSAELCDSTSFASVPSSASATESSDSVL